MEPKANLFERFELIDEYYAQNRKFSAPQSPLTQQSSFATQGSQAFVYQYQLPKPCTYQINQVYAREEIIIQRHEAKREEYYGRKGSALFDEYYGKKGRIAAPQRREEIIFQNHEAKAELNKTRFEDFASMYDYYIGRKERVSAPQRSPISQMHTYIIQGSKQQTCYNQHRPEPPYEYQVKPAFATKEMVMDAYEAAKVHGGVLIIDYSNRK